MMGCCIELMTPRIVLEADEVDVFAEILEDATYENKELMAKALWARWRDYCIGSCDLDAWVQGMKDRLALVGDKWDAVMSKALETELNAITDRSYERIVQRTAIEGTQGDVRTLSHEGEDKHVMEHEAMPQTASGETKYLDARQTDTNERGIVDTDKYAPNTQDKETYKADDTIPASTFSNMMRDYPSVLMGFADEFSGYFINRWY